MTPAIAIAMLGFVLSFLVACIAAVRWFVDLGRSIERIEQRLDKIDAIAQSVEGLRTSVSSLQQRVAKIEGAQSASTHPGPALVAAK